MRASFKLDVAPKLYGAPSEKVKRERIRSWKSQSRIPSYWMWWWQWKHDKLTHESGKRRNSHCVSGGLREGFYVTGTSDPSTLSFEWKGDSTERPIGKLEFPDCDWSFNWDGNNGGGTIREWGLTTVFQIATSGYPSFQLKLLRCYSTSRMKREIFVFIFYWKSDIIMLITDHIGTCGEKLYQEWWMYRQHTEAKFWVCNQRTVTVPLRIFPWRY